MLSGAAIKSLGKRFRDGNYGEEDVALLEDYRATFDEVLLTVSARLNRALTTAGVSFVIAGRSKRIRSIIRKLARPEYHAMDLSRMADVVGLRVLVHDSHDQETALAAIGGACPGARLIDYRDGVRPYRAAHVIVREDEGFRSVEIQVRTLPQQLWANESESFGEEAKAGGGDPDIQAYLIELSPLCVMLDREIPRSDADGVSPYFKGRLPLGLRLPVLQTLFVRAAARPGAEPPNESYIIVYDSETNQCYQQHKYTLGERQEALSDYRRLTRSLDENRYETLILNSNSDAAIQVTHPRFFPEPRMD